MIEILKQADYVLSPCGRPMAPPGYRYVDLPYVISFRGQLSQCGNLNEEARATVEICPAVTLPINTVVTVNCTAPQEGIGPEAFSLTVIGDTINIVLATDAGGNVTTFGSGIVAAILASPAASLLVTATLIGIDAMGPRSSCTVIAGVTQGLGTAASRVENKARVPFLCRGVSIIGASGTTGFRIWWPNSRNLEQLVNAANFQQSGSGMRTLQPEVIIEPDGKITIEIQPPAGNPGGVVFMYFWGVLRYLLKADGTEPQPYLPDVSRAPRIPGSQNQNIMAPEWRLGNQCTPETPDGYMDEPFTLYSPAIKTPVGQVTVGVPVEVPNDCEVFLIRNIQYNEVDDNTVTSGVAALQIRLPSGYSITNGDYLPDDWTGPVFPPIPVSGGGRIILDDADMDATGTGNITTTVQFDGVKRRKVS